MKFKQILTVIVLLIIFIFAVICYSYHIKKTSIDDYNSVANQLTAQEVLIKHFQFQNEKKDYLLDLTLSDNQKDVDFKLHNIDYIEIISIEEKGYDDIARDYVPDNFTGKITSFLVKFDVRYISEGQDSNGVKTLRYILLKENANSPWVVYNWGIDF